MNIFHISFECYPLAKVGGLADVVGTLPKYLNHLKQTASVVLPYYDREIITSIPKEIIFQSSISLGEENLDFLVYEIDNSIYGFSIYLVDIPKYLYRKDIYNYKDDVYRFLSFQLAVLVWFNHMETKPDIIHCHDHHTGLIPFFISYGFQFSDWAETPTVLTIHNAQYQGQFSYTYLNLFPEFDHKHLGMLDWDQQINPLASAIKCAWKVTTVSPSYMKELQRRANGLDPLLSHESKKCIGILNGIDTKVWDPKKDELIPHNYNGRDIYKQRQFNKQKLCEKFGLETSKPLFSFIGRLVYEKGADLLPEAIEKALQQQDISILVLGSGQYETENHLKNLIEDYKGKYNVYIGYDEALSHEIYASTDFLLMPSRVEPCGLNQMYALRYGTIPIVRSTGGLIDTVPDIGDEGYGICHNQASVEDILYSIHRAVELYEDPEKMKEIQKRIIKVDNSWNNSAKQYVEVYESLKITQ